MNPFLNPFNSLPFLKNYFTVPRRLQSYDKEKMQTYRDKAFRTVVRYAYTVPLYKKKYKAAGITPDDIQGIKDITKLPFITKKDIVENYPEGVVPVGYDTRKASVAYTSGSTGKPVSVFIDFSTLSQGLLLSVRQGITYGYNPRTAKIASVGTFNQGRIDRVYDDAILAHTKMFRKSNNYLSMNAFDPIKEIITKLNEFQPDIIYTYPVILQHLAYFKKKGHCEHINPKILQVGGYSMDEYTREYIRNVFRCPTVNLYQSVEACGTITYECLQGTWHINHDFYEVEAIDENMQIVLPGERGHIVITRLFGQGTPIIRYTGMDDWVTLLPECKCPCGVQTPIFKNGVEGRISARVILPDGRVYPAQSFEMVSMVLNELKTYKIPYFQIIQNKIDEIEVNLVVDTDLRDVDPPLELIFKKIYERYREKCGPNVNIIVKEVTEIKSPQNKPSPLVVSKIKLEDGYKILESQ
ncbi:MAG: phenylacetate--CoA ligase family protein [Candidatus Thermoplasmatota archaeon]|nr:phenylacetate--CoA ligase family protein [Candidatus Thermoplasmatota archaeon]